MAGFDDVTRRKRLSVGAYRRITFVALVALFAIVVTGSLVRLTGSGLGCADWPRCSKERFIDVSTGHGAIEQINRLFTGIVAASVVLAVLASLRLEIRRPILTKLSLGLVAGVIAQVVIGGIVVLTGLNPWANMAHFLVSMILLANALVLHRLTGTLPGSSEPVRSGGWPLEYIAGAFGLGAVITGTVVTASGPHAGDENAVRFGFAIHNVARVHSVTVLATLAIVALLLWRSRGGSAPFEHAVARLFGLGLLQALVGYVQYLADIPALLVAVHIALAGLVWLSLVDVIILSLAGRSVSSRRVAQSSSGSPQPSTR